MSTNVNWIFSFYSPVGPGLCLGECTFSVLHVVSLIASDPEISPQFVYFRGPRIQIKNWGVIYCRRSFFPDFPVFEGKKTGKLGSTKERFLTRKFNREKKSGTLVRLQEKTTQENEENQHRFCFC